LTSSENARLVEGFGSVDEVIDLDRAAYRRANLPDLIRQLFHLVRRLRRGRFALAVDFQGYGETAWLTRLTGAPHRWGNVYRWIRGWAYTRRVPRNHNVHPAEGNRLLLGQCGLRLTPARND